MDSRIMLLLVMVAVATSAPAPAPARAPAPAITCSLPATLTVSTNFCNAYDEQGMGVQTKGCEGFLTMADATPTAECCRGLNNVAYNRTACVCKLTFFPASSSNVSRQRDLPRLCGVLTDLCAQCPMFLTSHLNGTSAAPVSSYEEEDSSTASTIGAISLAVVFGLLLLGAMVFGVLSLVKKAKKKSPESFEAPPPGGAF